MENGKKKLMVGAALSGLLLVGGCATMMDSGSAVMGECHGVNSCKGSGACGGKGHSCAGKNACKGKGWLKMSKSDCESKGGTFKS